MKRDCYKWLKVTQLIPAQQNLSDAVETAMNQFVQELMQSAMQDFMGIVKTNLENQEPLDAEMVKKPTKKMLTKKEAADYIGVGMTTFTDIINSGDFYPLTRLGHNRGKVFVNREKLDQWLNEQDASYKTIRL